MFVFDNLIDVDDRACDASVKFKLINLQLALKRVADEN